MARTWVPIPPALHLRIFGVSLAVVLLTLAGFLFGVHLDAVVPVRGVIVAHDQQEVRTLLAGLAEPGWYEGKIVRADADPVTVRLDGLGNGMADPAAGLREPIADRVLKENGRSNTVTEVRFHRLQAGDELWPGQVVATIRADELRGQLLDVEDQLHHLESRNENHLPLRRQRDRLRDRLADAVLRVPESAERWLVLDVPVAPFQAVKPGDVIAAIVPVDPRTHQPLDLIARLDVAEKHFAELAPGQPVRLHSTLFNHRVHGSARARIDKLEPLGEATPSGERRFHALAPVTEAPFDLRIGSTFQAEVVTGRKRVYRLILEH